MTFPWSFRALGIENGPSKRAVQRAVFLARTPNPILKARRYEAGTRSYRKVAEEFGVSREEVCQYLTLLRRLPAGLVSAVEKEKRPEVLRKLSYRKLLAIARSDQSSRHG